MREVEAKIRNIDKKEIISKLEEWGASKVFAGKVVDYRFDTPDRVLSRQGKALRLRRKGKNFYMTLKGRKKSQDNILSRDETGIRISNMWTAQQMLTNLGYVKIFEMEKYRTEYRIGDVNFDIDEYPGMTPILEIESSCRKKVDKYIKMLGLDIRKVGRIYIREILQAKKNYDEKKKKEYKHFEE